MKRLTQYLLALGAIGIAAVFAALGFTYTGGAVPWGERFAAVMQGGAKGGGSLFQFGRGGLGGFFLAGPLRDDVSSFAFILVLLVGLSVGLYWWKGASSGK
ncbi:MAG: cobalamin transport operon protein [Halodesulfurarchaeum sp.]